MSYAQEQRLKFIDFLLKQYGYLNRSAIELFFGVDGRTATRDFKKYEKVAPHNMVYDKPSKKYVKGYSFKAKWY